MYKKANIALYYSPDYQTSFQSTGLLVQEKCSEWKVEEVQEKCSIQIFKMVGILDFQSEWF